MSDQHKKCLLNGVCIISIVCSETQSSLSAEGHNAALGMYKVSNNCMQSVKKNVVSLYLIALFFRSANRESCMSQMKMIEY